MEGEERYDWIKCCYPGCTARCYTWPDGDRYHKCALCSALCCDAHGTNHGNDTVGTVCDWCFEHMDASRREEVDADDTL